MIDFTDCEVLKKGYSGANGNKLCIKYNNELYMLKFPKDLRDNKRTDLDYSNGCISEHLCSTIFNILDIPAQNTQLGIYEKNNQLYTVVACKDFEEGGFEIKDFAAIKNTVLTDNKDGYDTQLDSVLYAIENQTILNKEELLTRFWDTFALDSILGNFDRHNGNWGYLYNSDTNEAKLAPIFDCGSCMFPQAGPKAVDFILSSQEQIDKRTFTFPTSALKIKRDKINYYDFLTTTDNKECLQSVIKIHNKLEQRMEKVHNLIDSIESISDKQKTFYKIMLNNRFEKILCPAYERAVEILHTNDKNIKDLNTEDLNTEDLEI